MTHKRTRSNNNPRVMEDYPMEGNIIKSNHEEVDLSKEEIKRETILCFRATQAARAAFFSACFLVLAGAPLKLIPASSTIEEKTGECPGPDRVVV